MTDRIEGRSGDGSGGADEPCQPQAGAESMAGAGAKAVKKKIAVFSDGTGNSSAKLEKTNVWRMFQALEQNRRDVMALYDDGVGTASNRYLAALGGAFGWGLKRNVLDLYKFVCRNYEHGDDIYGFGFSRGAFTIRVLVGLIDREGLVPFKTEEDLHRNAKAAYRSYRSQSFKSKSPLVWAGRWIRDALISIKDFVRGNPTYAEVCKERDVKGLRQIPIRFLGLFDTVEAYGLPILELKRGIDWVLWPMLFGDFRLSARVKRAFHALSLDDERSTFHPLHWDETAEADMVAEGKVEPGRITQVWFAGVHTNVGGGYPEDQLALVPLAWMMNQAVDNGLPLAMSWVESVNADKSPYARIYDSREGLKSYYRYLPRSIPDYRDKSNVRAGDKGTDRANGKKIRAIVHGSVLMRMHFGSDGYAPITLPRKFWVLAPDGELIQKRGVSDELRIDNTKRVKAAAQSKVKPDDVIADEKADLRVALRAIDRPDSNVVGILWDTVWWRRLAYFLTIGLTTILVAYPLLHGKLYGGLLSLLRLIPFFGGTIASNLKEVVDEVNGTSIGVMTALFDTFAGFVPGYLGPWSKAAKANPIEFGFVVSGILLFMYLGSKLRTRVHDRAVAAWNPQRRGDYRAWVANSRLGWRNTMGLALLVSLLLFVAAFVFGFQTLTKIEIGVAVAVFLVLFLMRMWEAPFQTQATKTAPLRGSLALRLARVLRKNYVLVTGYRAVFKGLVPIAFAAAIIVTGLYVANRVVFDTLSAVGAFCKPTKRYDLRSVDGPTKPTGSFRTDAMCWNSGLELEAGRRYRITLEIPANGDWFDRTKRTDVYGSAANGAAQVVAAPMRRWWFQNYFQPIARIGTIGNDEYLLESRRKVERHRYCRDPEKYAPDADAQAAIASARQAGNIRGALASREISRRVLACEQCDRTEIAKHAGEEVDPTTGKITKEFAELLLKCSATPPGRRKVEAEITARTSGELFIYVNDAVLLPRWKVFYDNNSGTASIKVEPVAE